MKKINLYIFSERNKSIVYGIGTYLKELTNSLPKEFFNITLIHLNTAEQEIRIDKTDHVSHWYLPSAKEILTQYDDDYSVLYYRNVVYLLQLYISDTNRLIFHINSIRNRSLAKRLKAVFNCKLFFSIHYFSWSFDLFGDINRFKNVLENTSGQQNNESIYQSYIKEIELFNTVNHIICLSESTCQIVEKFYRQEICKLSVIYNGLSDYRRINEKKALRRKYCLSDTPVILFVGRLDDIKGLRFLIIAFKKILEVIPNCRLIIAGNGDFETYMRECEGIWTNITFTGLVDRKHLYEFYTLADIGAMMSFHEQCSYVAIEMMMHALPIIGTTALGLNEMIEDGCSGLHIPIIESQGMRKIDTMLLADKIICLLQNPEKRKLMGENSRRRYETLYASEIMGKKMLDIYSSILEKD